MEDEKINKQQAEEWFEKWCDDMDIDIDESIMDEDEVKSFRKLKNTIIRGICDGSISFNENNEAVYSPKNPNTKRSEPITFHEKTGASLMAMDGKRKGHDISRTYAVMADMTKTHPRS